MTLVELLAALTLSSMLLVVLFGLMVQLSKTRQTVQHQFPFVPWKSNLAGQLQFDYRGCRSVLVRPKELRLESYSQYLDRDGRERRCPAQIRYVVVTEQDTNWLYRENSNLLTNEVTRELVCKHVVGFEIDEPLSTDVAPGILRLTIVFDSESDQLFEVGPGEVEFRREQSLTINLARHGGIKR